MELNQNETDIEKIHFYDRRIRLELGRYKLGYNGFVKLRLDKDKAIAEYIDLEDTCVFEEEWTIKNGQLDWKVLNVLPELAVR